MSSNPTFCARCGQRRAGNQQCCVESLGPDPDSPSGQSQQPGPQILRTRLSRTTQTTSISQTPLSTLSTNGGRSRTTRNATRTASNQQPMQSAPQDASSQLVDEPIALFGVGPSSPNPPVSVRSPVVTTSNSAPESVQDQQSAGSRSETPKTNYTRQDIWRWLRPLDDKQKTAYENGVIPAELPVLTSRPKASWLACLFCERKMQDKENLGKFYKIYNNSNCSQTTTIEKHMRSVHAGDWGKACVEAGVKQKPTPQAKNSPDDVQSEKFNLDGMMHYLLNWIAVDDQPISIVESPEFRRFLLYCARQLSDDDIPHRTKTTKAMVQLFYELMERWGEELRNTPGRISFTTDIWTDPNLNPYMAVTAHYIHETTLQLKCRARLIAFRHIPGTHEGAAIGSHFVDILVGLKIEHKVGQTTADNASNNNTMVGWIEDALTARSIPFSRLSNCIRCFPHIINLAAQELVDSLKHTPTINGVDRTFLRSLQSDPVARCQELIVACRLTSLRRKEFRDTITELNESGAKVPNLALIYDVVTRWSATFNMISRFLLIQQVVTVFLAKPRNHDILREKGLNSADLAVLGHILQVLLVFHRAQELLSSECTPTLALVLPAYKLIFQILRMYINTNQLPHLNFAIRATITKLEGYMELARQNECYGMAMFLNPSSKKGWMVKHWTNAEVERCVGKVTEAMLAYRREECGHKLASTSTSQHPTFTAHNRAADNLGAGFRGLEDLLASLSRAASNGSSSLDDSGQVPMETVEEDQEVLNRNKVEAELLRYISDPPFSQAMTTLNLMEWWRIHQHTYPLLWKVARDILPTQASSVPCERVFSSSKQTTTPQRNALSPEMIEKLQILKFGLKQKQLDFTDGWIKQPEEMIGGLDHVDDSDFA